MKQLFLTICLLLINCLTTNAQIDTGYIACKDAEIYYKIFGTKGKPVLLINGGPGFSSNYLDTVANVLAKDRIVIVYDQRGTGKSEIKAYTKQIVSLTRNLSDIEALRTHLGHDKIDIIGHAYGGALAMMYAYKYPHRVRKMILSSSIGTDLGFLEPMMANLKLRLDVKTANELSNINQALIEKGDSENFYKQRFDLVADAYVYDKSKIEEARRMHKQHNDFNQNINQIIWDEMQLRDYDITNQIKMYKGEVLILHGRQDVIGESVPMITHSALENSKLVFINKAGRYLWIDQPDDYYFQIDDFLK